MARRSAATGDGEPELPPPSPPILTGEESGIETTGRYIVIFKDQAVENPSLVETTLSNLAGIQNVISSSDFEDGGISAEALADSPSSRFPSLGIAVVSGEEAVQALSVSLSAESDSPILAIEPEYVAYPSALDPNYLRGFRDAANHLYEEGQGGETTEEQDAEIAAVFADNAQFTWGLQATRAHTSRFTGQGIRVAVLDTGFDFAHPDFRGRAITSRAFVAGVTPQDVNGHGTHCIGTACGSARPATGVRRYGVATQSHIFVGKVFNNNPRPSAPTGSVIAAIEWALANGCRVASLSLGAPINQQVLQYSVPLQRALNAGLLVVAAAGNNASRPLNPGFVESPANADAAMAVAAVDNRMNIARFSARSSTVVVPGGLVNIAGPGVSVFSSVLVANGRHDFFNGTSMATPHVAGIAALWSQATGERGATLWSRILRTAVPLPLGSRDVGAGLARAPQ